MAHQHSHSGIKNIKLAFFLNFGFTILEFIGGFYLNSVAIMSDALHDLGDSFSLGLSWFLEGKSKQKADEKYSFGYSRLSLLGALINSLILIAGSIFIISEAIDRLYHPETSHAPGMIIFAVVGVLVNGYAAWKLSSGKSMNEKVVSWHLLEDVLGWLAILIVAIILLFTDNQYLDPALSLLITLFILFNVGKRLKETFEIFLQSVPGDIDVNEIKARIMKVTHVDSLHHVHVWSLEGENHVFTAHLVLRKINSFEQIIETKENVKEILKDYPFRHYTIETELDGETCNLE